MTRPQYMLVLQRLGFGVKEGMMMTLGQVSDLLAIKFPRKEDNTWA